MVVYFGADHRGFNLKERLKGFLHDQGYEVVDVGNDRYDEKDDYPDFAVEVGKRVSLDPEKARGVLICGSGVGMDVTVNKFPRVRSALAISSDQVYDARRDDNVNVLTIAANFTSQEEAEKMVKTFIGTDFSREERHERRLSKLANVEIKNEITNPF